jgi:hypothetical protein
MTRFVPARVLIAALVSACVALPAASAYAGPPPAPNIVYPSDNGPLFPAAMSIQGTGASAGDTVVVTLDATQHSVAADAGGGWEYDITGSFAQGQHTVSAHIVDPSNGTGPESGVTTFYYLLAPTLSGPSWVHPTANSIVLNYSGTEPNTTVKLIDADTNTTLKSGTADPSGAGTIAVPGIPSDGLHNYEVKQQHVVTSSPSNIVRVGVDTQAPATPAQLLPNFGLLADWSDGDFITNTTQVFVVSTEASDPHIAPVQMHWTLDGVGQTPVDPIGDGTTQIVMPSTLSQGSHTIVVTQVDAAGNTSSPTTIDFVLDSIGPSKLDMVSPQQYSSDASGVLQFKTDPNATVTMSLDGGPVMHDIADIDGNIEFDVAPLADGPHTIVASASDEAGNVINQTFHFTTDTTPPQAPVVSSPAPGSTITDHRPTIVFAGDPDTVNTIVIDGTPAGTATADDDGNATFAVPSALADGAHTLSITAVDQAQNSTDSAPITFTVAEPTTPPGSDPPGNGDPNSHPPRGTSLTLSSIKLSGTVLQTCKAHAHHCHEKTATLTLSVSAPATLKLALTQTVRHRTKTVATVTVKAAKAGKVTYVLHRKVGSHTLAHGSYKLVIQGTATADGSKSATVTKSISVR